MALGGIGLGVAGFLYHDLMQAQTETSRQIAIELRELNVRVMELEYKSKLPPQKTYPPS